MVSICSSLSLTHLSTLMRSEYYQHNKDDIKEKAKNKYTNLTEEEKVAKRQYSNNRYQKMKEKSS